MQLIAFVCAWCLFKVLRVFTFNQASNLGHAMGALVGPVLFGLNARARANLCTAFPDKSEAEITAIIKGMWRNFGRSIFEFCVLDKVCLLQDKDRFTVHGLEYLDQIRDGGGFVFGGHIGNWELLPLLGVGYGLNPVSVYRSANNPFVERLIQGQRARMGILDMAPKGAEGARSIVKASSQARVIGMLVDQKMNDGIPVPFFGREAMTAPALAQLAIKYSQPVIAVQIIRRAGAKFDMVIEPPFHFQTTGVRTTDIKTAMTQVNQTLERWITEHPEQWFWMHNRWPKQTSSL